MKYKKLLLSFAAVACVVTFSSAASAQARIVVKFAKGAHSASGKGSIKGYTYIDYVLGARAGQNMMVELSSRPDKAQFVVRDPDGENLEYATGVTEWSGDLQKNGNYIVRVLMSRNEARRKGAATSFVVKFTIK